MAGGMKSKLFKLRMIQLADIVSIPLFAWVAQSRGPGSSDWTRWHWLMVGLAVYAALAGFFFRRRLIRRSEEALAKDTSDPKALKQWEAGHFIAIVMAEGIVFGGVVVRTVIGGTLWQASLFFATGFLLLLLWTPRMPSRVASSIPHLFQNEEGGDDYLPSFAGILDVGARRPSSRSRIIVRNPSQPGEAHQMKKTKIIIRKRVEGEVEFNDAEFAEIQTTGALAQEVSGCS
jgi:hypothetical protein